MGAGAVAPTCSASNNARLRSGRSPGICGCAGGAATRRGCGGGDQERHNCAAVFAPWSFWEMLDQKGPTCASEERQLVLPGKDQEAPRRACAPRCGEIRSRIAGESEARPAAGPAGWGSEGPAAGTPEGRIRSRNRSRNRRPNQKAGSAGIRSRHQNAGTPNIRTPAIRTPKFGQPNQKIRAAETPD